MPAAICASRSRTINMGDAADRVSDEFMATLDAWSARQDDAPTRSEAIRRLVELGLKARK